MDKNEQSNSSSGFGDREKEDEEFEQRKRRDGNDGSQRSSTVGSYVNAYKTRVDNENADSSSPKYTVESRSERSHFSSDRAVYSSPVLVRTLRMPRAAGTGEMDHSTSSSKNRNIADDYSLPMSSRSEIGPSGMSSAPTERRSAQGLSFPQSDPQAVVMEEDFHPVSFSRKQKVFAEKPDYQSSTSFPRSGDGTRGSMFSYGPTKTSYAAPTRSQPTKTSMFSQSMPRKESTEQKLMPAVITPENQVTLRSNLFDIRSEPRLVFHYDVNMVAVLKDRVQIDLFGNLRIGNSSIENNQLCFIVVKVALNKYGKFSKKTGTVYDCGRTLYTSEKLELRRQNDANGSMRVRLTELPEEARNLVRWENFDKFKVRIVPTREMPSFNTGDVEKHVARHFLNLLSSESGKAMGLTVFGDGKLIDMTKAPECIGRGQEIRSGAKKGIRFTENAAGESSSAGGASVGSLVINARGGVFFVSQPVSEVLKERLGLRLGWNGELSELESETASQYLEGLKFTVEYDKAVYKIVDLSRTSIRNLKIVDQKTRKEVFFMNALEADVGEEVARKCNLYFPALVAKKAHDEEDSRMFYFPMELAKLTDNQRVPTEKQSQRHEASEPHERYEEIIRLAGEMNLNEDGCQNEVLKLFGVSVSYAPKTVSSVRRQAPKLFSGNNQPLELDSTHCNWTMEGSQFLLAGKTEYCFIVSERKHKPVAERAMRAIKRKCDELGVVVNNWKFDQIEGQPQSLKEVLFEYFDKLHQSAQYSNDSFVIFVDSKSSKSHGLLKLAEAKYNIGTQQLTAETAKNLERLTTSCIHFVKKMNVKLGGLNYRVDPEIYAQNKWISNDGLLIISYDVSHPGKAYSEDRVDVPSVVGFAFNGGSHRESFVGDYHFQLPRREKVDSAILNERVKWILQTFITNRNGFYPNKILVIRDGVGEGQFKMVIDEELQAIRKSCADYGHVHGRYEWKPTFALAIAVKKGNTRVFRDDGNRIENVLPLTVIDRGVTRENVNEALIVTSKASIGTARPICYKLLVNEIGIKNMDEFEALMIALTFSHQVSDAPISLPEPVYQADEWAKRGNLIWEAFVEHIGEVPMKRGTRPPTADFELMTDRFAYWKKPNFNGKRLNA